jgi:hypothetical protein
MPGYRKVGPDYYVAKDAVGAAELLRDIVLRDISLTTLIGTPLLFEDQRVKSLGVFLFTSGRLDFMSLRVDSRVRLDSSLARAIESAGFLPGSTKEGTREWYLDTEY